MITDEQLAEFQALYEREFGEKLERQEALRQATALINLVQIVCFGKNPKKDTIPSL